MLTVNWATKVVFVPKTYTQFVQFEPVSGLEVRQLDLDAFRLDLKEIEGSQEGIPFVDIHEHTAPKTLGGVTYARFVEIINGYSIEFEDGQYAVNLTGANTNVQDVAVVNQVSVRPNNSAGLTFSEEINNQSFTNNRVYINVDLGSTGTQFPRGTPTSPVNNYDDAYFIASQRNYTHYDLDSGSSPLILTVAQDISDTHWFGNSANDARLFIPGIDTTNCTFDQMLITGTTDGVCTIRNGAASGVFNFSGSMVDVALNGTITLDNTTTQQVVLHRCYSAVAGVARPTLDLNGINAPVIIRGYWGGLTIKNMTQNIAVSFDGDSATLELDSSCTAGTINVGGMTELINNSTIPVVNTSRNVTTLAASTGSLTPLQTQQLTELWQRFGFDIANPTTYDTTDIEVAGITLSITENPDGSKTVTRQP